MKSYFKSFAFIVTLSGVCFLLSCKEDEIINTAPSISDQSFSIDENSRVGTVVGVINASDPDEGQELSYKIISGNGPNVFELNSIGELSIKNASAIDFELNESFELLVSVKDGFEEESMAKITVEINNISISTEGLIAYYSFGGSAKDFSGNSYDGTVNGASAAFDRNGNPNFALSFDGIDDYIALGSDFDLENASINIWFKIRSNQLLIYTPQFIFSSDHPNKQNGMLSLSIVNHGYIRNIGYYLELNYNRNGKIVSIVIEEKVNNWHMATVVYEGSDYRFFLDGILIGSNIDNGNINSQNGLSLATVGCDRNYVRMFSGEIDDIRIYNRALTLDEIESLYNEME